MQITPYWALLRAFIMETWRKESRS